MPVEQEVTEVIDESTAAPASDANTQTLPEDESKNPPDPSAQSEEAVSDTDDEDPKKPGRIPQWRVDEITRARRDAERRAEVAERRAEEAEARSGKPNLIQSNVQLPAALESLDAFIKANPKFTDWDEAQKQFLVARDQYRDQHNRQSWERDRTVKELQTKFDSELGELPELKEVEKVIGDFDKPTAGVMQEIAQQFSNGVQVIKEALLTPEFREQLKGFERTRNRNGIEVMLTTISTRLLMEAKASKAEGKEPSAASGAPKPPTPVRQTRSTWTGEPPDSASNAEWQRWRKADLEKKGKG